MMQSARVEQLTNSQPLASSLAGRKVLVIDDSSTIRRTAQIFLSKVDCQVVLAEDGFDALAKLGDFKPDIVFCDILMPKLDGFQLLAQLRASDTLRHVPVILLSARAGEEARIEGLQAGADDYLAKPFAAAELLARTARDKAGGRRL